MRQYGEFEAKKHFSTILKDVVKGDKFIITQNSVPVAMIIPFTQEVKSSEPVVDAIRALKKLRRGVTLGKILDL